jgi:hypothetical protein
MSDKSDPFELLPQFVDPEPDPVIMNATIAQSREAFTHHRHKAPDRSGLVVWLRRSANWLAPAAIGVFAVVVAIVAAPGLLRTTPTVPTGNEQVADAPSVAPPAVPNDATLSRGNTQMADAPPGDAAPADGGTQMGMVPGGGAPGQPPPQVVSTFEGSNVRIGLRLSTMALELYLPDISGEATIDTQAIFSGEQIEVLEAFRVESRDVVAVRFRVNESRFWRVYRPIDGAYARDMDLSALVSDAADQTEVETRLSSP